MKNISEKISKQTLKDYLINMYCMLVKRRLELTDTITLCSNDSYGKFWLYIDRKVRDAGIHELHSHYIKAGDNCHPKSYKGDGTDAESIVNHVREILSKYRYGNNGQFYFQLPERYQTEIIPYYGTPSFVHCYSGKHYEVSRISEGDILLSNYKKWEE